MLKSTINCLRWRMRLSTALFMISRTLSQQAFRKMLSRTVGQFKRKPDPSKGLRVEYQMTGMFIYSEYK